MNLTATTTDPTLNPLPPSPPLALVSSSSSSVRIVIPSTLDNNIQSQTLLQQRQQQQQQIPSLVTPPTTTAALFATDMSVANTLMVSNPLAPQLAVESNTTPNNNDDDDDDDAFMMDIEIPHILDDDEDVEADDHPPSSVPLVDADNDDHGDTTLDAPRYTTTDTPLTTTTAAVPARGLAHPNVAAAGGAADKEKVGRWTEQEHLVFLEGLRTHGKQWKVIATMIGTRTVVQVRTHAQKYFQKLDRNSGGAGANSSSSNSSNCSTSHNKVATSKFPVVAATTAVSAISLSDPQPEQRHGTTLLSPNSTILPQQRPTYTKRKSLPSSLPSRNPKKSRTGNSSHKMNPRLSMGHRGTSTSTTTTTTTQTMVPPPSTLVEATNNNELSSYPSYISKSSSSTGSDENWSTISPDNVIWDRVDFGNYSEYANIISEDNSNSMLGVYNNTADVVSHQPSDNHNGTSSAYDLLGDDPLEWLIETDCTQQYLPESSLPLFPFHAISSDYCHDPHLDDKLEASNDDTEILLRMTDPNVTVQSLFLPTTSSTSDDDMAILEQ